jgi:hypothetical protein
VAFSWKHPSVTIRLAIIGHGKVGEALRGNLSSTVPRPAIEATRSQRNAAANTQPGKIAEGSAILAVDMTRADTAKWARSANPRRAGDHDHRVFGVVQTLHVQVRIIRKQYRQRAGEGSHLPLSLEHLV